MPGSGGNNNINTNNQFITDYIETMSLDQQGLLQSIDLTLKSIARSDGIQISQSSLRDLMAAEQHQQAVADRQRRSSSSDSTTQDARNRRTGRRSSDDSIEFDKQGAKKKASKMWEDIINDFESTLIEGLTGSKNPFDAVAKNLIDNFSKSLGVDKADLGKEIGKRVLKNLDNIPYKSIISGQSTTIGKQLQGEMNWYKDKVNKAANAGMSSLAKSLGGNWENIDLFKKATPEEVAFDSINDLNNTVDSRLDDVIDAIWQSNGGQGSPQLGNEFDDAGDVVADVPYREVPSIPSVTDIVESGQGEGSIGDIVGNILGDQAGDAIGDIVGKKLAPELGKLVPALTEAGGAELAAGAAGAAEGLGAVGVAAPELSLALMAATVAIDAMSKELTEVIGPAVEGTKAFLDGLFNAFNRDITAAVKYNELARKRAEADIKSIREAAYQVIEDAANRVMDVWDRIETTVAATQLTDKAGVQDLWSAYASRLKEEGLAKYVSSADIMERLETVLKQGLQGKVAEEFAYQATLLSSAIPTEDFFQYASTYASIAANAIKAGSSQAEAIDLATQELRSFADNLLYANREVAGGFTTSLVNSSDLFEKSAQIALSAHETTTTGISRVLTTISGAVGSIAPDLASNVVDAVYKAAVGGNSSEITALRSMSGVGAGNTAFLQALVKNPKQVLVTLFQNLSQLQGMSSQNYMEVAEGLSQVFGMSMESFARVDFNYLANAIDNMNLTVGDELNKNLTLLQEGQTTSNDSQMRMQKINEYMIEEGLAYVLDNQVAREIQKHMWDEQLNRELMEAQYSVDLVGGSKQMMVGILTTVKGLLSMLNPVGWVSKIGNIALTALEGVGQSADLKEILERGKVGEGNTRSFYQLSTYEKDLNLATPIVELLGGVSETTSLKQLLKLNDTLSNPLFNWATGNLSITETAKSIDKLAKNGVAQVNDSVKQTLNKTQAAINKIEKTLKDTASKVGEITGASAASAAESASATEHAKKPAPTKKEQESLVDNLINSASEALKDVSKSTVDTIKAATSKLISDGLKSELDKQNAAYSATMDEIDKSNANIVSKSAQAIGATFSSAYESLSSIFNSISNSEAATAAKDAVNKGMSTIAKTVDSVKGLASNATSYFNNSIIGKAVGSLISSGDWRNKRGFNAYYQNFGESGTGLYDLPQQTDATSLSEMINSSISSYIANETKRSSKIDEFRKEFTDNSIDLLTEDWIEKLENEGSVLHRGFASNQEVVEEVLKDAKAIAEEGSNTSFEDWLDKFQKQTGIENLSALLSEYGEDISTLEALYLQEQTARQDALTKARDLHEVQFWEDMQNFATVDFPSFMREWERYYIQHEAYTDASNEAYAEAVSLSVKEKGEMGDSVLALAEALTENNLWMQDLGHELKDPTLQTNVILSKILLVVEAIMQQNNETSVVSIPTALSSLGLGISNV